LTKYGDNPKLYKQLFSLRYQNRKLLNLKDWFKLDKSKLLLDIDVTNLQRLKDIDIRISRLTSTTEKEVLTSMMRHIKNLDRAEDIAIMGVDARYLKLFETGSNQVMSAKKF
jgi:hypothetical protein